MVKPIFLGWGAPYPLSVSESQLQSLPLNPTRNIHDEQLSRPCVCLHKCFVAMDCMINIDYYWRKHCFTLWARRFFSAGCRKVPRDTAEPWSASSSSTSTLTDAHELALLLEYVWISNTIETPNLLENVHLDGFVWFRSSLKAVWTVTHTLGPRCSSESPVNLTCMFLPCVLGENSWGEYHVQVSALFLTTHWNMSSAFSPLWGAEGSWPCSV